MISPYKADPLSPGRRPGPAAWLACVLSFSLSNVLRADAPSHPCAAIVDDEARLICYDRAFGRPSAPPIGAPGEPEFGAATPEPARKEVTSITATVATVERRRDGLFVVTLDNGQVWAQTELDSRAEVR